SILHRHCLELLSGGVIQANSDSKQDGRPKRGDRSSPDGIPRVQQIFKCQETLHPSREFACEQQIQGTEVAERKQVLIVVKLLSHESTLQCDDQAGRIEISQFRGELMLRNLWHTQSLEGCVGRKIKYRRVSEGIST